MLIKIFLKHFILSHGQMSAIAMHFQLDDYAIYKQNCRFGIAENLRVIFQPPCIHQQPLFGKNFGLAEWLECSFSRMWLTMRLPSIAFDTMKWWHILASNWWSRPRRRSGFNRMAPHITHGKLNDPWNPWTRKLKREFFQILSNRPPKIPCDLNLFNFFLWGFLKGKMSPITQKQFLDERLYSERYR